MGWPPSPGLTFATIPILKKFYNALYNHTFSDLEKKWDRAVQRRPREGETAEEIEHQAAEDDGRAIFDVEWVHEEVDVVAPAAADGAVPAQPAAGAQNGGVVNANNAGPRRLNRWALHQDVSAAYIATTVMGALAFPAISSAMGEIINTLPLKWRERIGGCLLVVLKDMVTLYCKWRKARDFGKRKVLDYVG